jgi:hypothetical protein
LSFPDEKNDIKDGKSVSVFSLAVKHNLFVEIILQPVYKLKINYSKKEKFFWCFCLVTVYFSVLK